MSTDLATIQTENNGEVLEQNLEHFASFWLGEQLLGIPIQSVEGLLHMENICHVPLSDSTVLGLTNVRGHIVTVLDLHKLLGLSKSEALEPVEIEKDMGVLIEHGVDHYALLVDRISDVIDVPAPKIQTAPSTLPSQLLQHVRGVYRVNGDNMVILNLDGLLT